MLIVFHIDQANQRERINYVRERASGAFSRHEIMVEEDFTNSTCYLTVRVAPDPPYGPTWRYAIFPGESSVYWEWPA
jgi:hypothetical protein